MMGGWENRPNMKNLEPRISNQSYLQIEEQRKIELRRMLDAWVDAPETNRRVLYGRNSIHFKTKTFFVLLMENGQQDLVRGDSREDAIAQALQIIEARKSVATK